MFTGIIKHLGVVKRQTSRQLTISYKTFSSDLAKAESIAVNGVCLTITKVNPNSNFTVDIMPETLEKTTLGNLKYGDLVNLELPVTVESFLSGHLLAGHVDGLARLESITKAGNSHILEFSVPRNLCRFIAQKGSIAINGISLTVIEAEKNSFSVGIVPYTWKQTNLHNLKRGSYVNIETDILAKYLGKLLENE